MRLDPVEARVVGSLVEKQLTTPQQYPLTLNSLTLACNQASNRDPVVDYPETRVQDALDSLKQKGLVRFVLPSHGRSVVRYRHVLDEKLAFDGRQLALVAVLLLRGPQTVGELRTRTERMARFDSAGDVESDLLGLTRGEEPAVARLARRPGQKEERWTQLLADPGEAGEAPQGPGVVDGVPAFPAGAGVPAGSGAPAGSGVPAGPGPSTPADRADGGAVRRIGDELGDELAALREEVALLREEVLELRLELAEGRDGA